MLVGQICTRTVEIAETNKLVACAAKRMHQRSMRSLVVVNDAGEPIGIVTNPDFLGQVLAESRSPADTQH